MSDVSELHDCSNANKENDLAPASKHFTAMKGVMPTIMETKKVFAAALLPFLLGGVLCAKRDVRHAIITGRVDKPEESAVLIKGSPVPIADGGFRHCLKISKPSYVGITIGNEHGSLYLSPGDSIHVDYREDSTGVAMRYTGIGSTKNNYLRAHSTEISKFRARAKDLMRLDEQAFGEEVDRLAHTFTDKLNTCGATDARFLELERARILFWVADLKLWKKESLQDSSMQALVDTLDLNNEAFLDIDSYHRFLNNYLHTVASALYNDEPSFKESASGHVKAKLAVIEKHLSNPKIKNTFLTRTVELSLGISGVKEDSDEIMAYFNKHCSDSTAKSHVNRLYQKKKRLTKGNRAPNFACADRHGNTVGLSDFEGRCVYLDFWTTWCGPCKQELPHLQKLKKKYQHENIAFISISLDDDRDAWIEMLKAKRMTGTQLWAPKGWDSAVVKEYALKGVPCYVLIDVQGKIAGFPAPRPSDDKIEDLFSSVQ